MEHQFAQLTLRQYQLLLEGLKLLHAAIQEGEIYDNLHDVEDLQVILQNMANQPDA